MPISKMQPLSRDEKLFITTRANELLAMWDKFRMEKRSLQEKKYDLEDIATDVRKRGLVHIIKNIIALRKPEALDKYEFQINARTNEPFDKIPYDNLKFSLMIREITGGKPDENGIVAYGNYIAGFTLYMDKARDVAGFVSVGPRQSDVLSARGKVGDIMIDAVEAMLGLHTLEKK